MAKSCAISRQTQMKHMSSGFMDSGQSFSAQDSRTTLTSLTKGSGGKWLVGGFFLPLSKIWVNWDDELPNIWKNKKCTKPPTSSWMTETRVQLGGQTHYLSSALAFHWSCSHICIYIYICLHIYVCIYIYIQNYILYTQYIDPMSTTMPINSPGSAFDPSGGSMARSLRRSCAAFRR